MCVGSEAPSSGTPHNSLSDSPLPAVPGHSFHLDTSALECTAPRGDNHLNTVTIQTPNPSSTRLSLFWEVINSFTRKKKEVDQFSHLTLPTKRQAEEKIIKEWFCGIWISLTNMPVAHRELHSPASISFYTIQPHVDCLSVHRNPSSPALVGLSKPSFSPSLAPWTSPFLNPSLSLRVCLSLLYFTLAEGLKLKDSSFHNIGNRCSTSYSRACGNTMTWPTLNFSCELPSKILGNTMPASGSSHSC